jgi:hypothetical protein
MMHVHSSLSRWEREGARPAQPGGKGEGDLAIVPPPPPPPAPPPPPTPRQGGVLGGGHLAIVTLTPPALRASSPLPMGEGL